MMKIQVLTAEDRHDLENLKPEDIQVHDINQKDNIIGIRFENLEVIPIRNTQDPRYSMIQIECGAPDPLFEDNLIIKFLPEAAILVMRGTK